MWVLLAFLSACLLGFYDVFKKKSLAGNAVLPVLMINTVVCALLFLPLIVASFCGVSDVVPRATLTATCCSNPSSYFRRGCAVTTP